MSKQPVLFLFIILMYVISCDHVKTAAGRDDRIVVFSEDVLWQTLQDTLKSTLGTPWEVPAVESKYVLDRQPISKFKLYKQQKNLMFIVAKNQKNALNGFVEKIIPKNYQPLIENETFNFFLLKNVYAKNQLLLLFVVNDYNDASRIFGKQFTELETYKKFDELVQERLTKEIYAFSEDKNVSELLSETQGYSLRAPYRFQLVDNKQRNDSNLVSLYSPNPIQWVCARKVFVDETTEIDSDFLVSERNYMMGTFFDGDSVDTDGIITEQNIIIDGLSGIRFQGAYKFYSKGQIVAGGPFISYALRDENMVYFIDAHVMNIGKRKIKDLMRLETIMKTFKRKTYNKTGM